MPAATPASLREHDPVVLQLLQLAAEIILAHPRAAPAALYDQCSAWADDLADALTPSGLGASSDPAQSYTPARARSRPPAPAPAPRHEPAAR